MNKRDPALSLEEAAASPVGKMFLGFGRSGWIFTKKEKEKPYLEEIDREIDSLIKSQN